MTTVPQYVADRVRRIVPAGCSVIEGSTPVVSFGNPHDATWATLGLNPSLREFTDQHGNWLSGDARRLATADSLGVADLSDASDAVVECVVADCYDYFNRNPYAWFTDLERVLQVALGGSFYDGTACHLDLVQWPTNPTWGKLSKQVKVKLINSDREFLRQQLQHESIRAVLLNGRGVVDQVEAMGFHLKTTGHVTVGSKSPSIVVGRCYGAMLVGWSENLQSGFGVSRDLKRAIAERVGEEIEFES